MGSNAVSQNAVASVMGFLLSKGYFNSSSPFLPQSIALFAEANTANQSGLSTSPVQVTSAKQVATLAGYGSPAHSEARILFPQSGGGTQLPVYLYLQASSGATASVNTLTPTGTATASGTIYLVIAGREGLDGGSYAVNIASGDTPTAQVTKMKAAIASVLGCPVLGTGTSTLVCTAKWTGLTSNDITVSVDLNGTNTGTTYAVVQTTPGAGTPSVAASLALIANDWKTLIINTYGLVSATMAEFEAWNGIPDPTNPTGRYAGTIWKPAIVISGSLLDDPSSITSAGVRPNNVTIAVAPAPLSAGLSYEAAANMAVVFGNVANNSPASDIIDQAYPDMPPPPAGSIPLMNDWSQRDRIVQLGCSTVDFTGGVYKVKDFVTTYNPSGEVPPFYRWVRDIIVYMNYKYGYRLKEVQNLIGKTLVSDGSTVTAANVIKPKMWKAIMIQYNKDCEARALIVDADSFTKPTISVTISGTNPNRLETTEEIKISGVVRIAATTVTGGFNFGN